VLIALIAGAFVFGRPYLFPSDWDETTKPFADAVEEARGAPIEQAFSVIETLPRPFEIGHDANVFGDWADDVPMWRALGLAAPDVRASANSQFVMERSGAYYSPTDGQVYTSSLTDPENTTDIQAAVTEAALDQEFGWSSSLTEVTPERAALVRALVRVGTTATLQRIDPESTLPTPSAMAGLPARLAQQLLAPSVFADVIGTGEIGDSGLADAARRDARLSGVSPLPLAAAATLEEGETSVGEATAHDRSFWYLVFAARLDAPTAHDASAAIVAASLTPFRATTGAACWAAVLETTDADAAVALGLQTAAWAIAAPVENAASMRDPVGNTIEFRVCDPGETSFSEATVTNGAASLLAYRATELAVIEGVTAAGGGDVEVAAGLDLLAASDVGDDLAVFADFSSIDELGAEAVRRVTPFVATATASVGAAEAAPTPADGIGSPDPTAPAEGDTPAAGEG
ncbi:MAG: hypothetical protein AAGG08_08660, partial [Actinomycetota bacterium]